ncbi:MAG TPA: 3-phosphoserine/phosphohydroxythreonine transaminase [Bacteroidales bacterium]|nr:3-phosphoserine/phosphohydroxythreonine transaminase [Bacteroidales bacterium]HOZ30914.1 3-phosphoserine/phosphohydroxythreonine transaminase [Bacteroidales bacterium]
MRKHIFNAGPCKLSDRTLENTAKAILEFNNSGQSIMEVSHRGKDFQAVMDDTVVLMKEILNIPDNYSVIFLGGGASMQFCMIPYNFLTTKAFYLNTGTWSTKAIKEAKLWGEVIEVSSKDKDFTYIPKNFNVPDDVDYVHITTNNTIRGSEIHEDWSFKAPLIADMSSDILSRPVDVKKYAMIYGGAQKNMGPAGVTFCIIRNDFLERVVDRPIPTMLKYTTHIEEGSMYNTPPCVNIFALRETLYWVKEMGGLKAMDKLANDRANMLYGAIDGSKMFKGTVAKEDRSRMNIVFIFEDKYKHLEEDFVKFASSKNCVGIKGHRSVGGFRASTYNACTLEDVKALVNAMKEFEKANA